MNESGVKEVREVKEVKPNAPTKARYPLLVFGSLII